VSLISQASIETALAEVHDHYLQQNWQQAKAIKRVEISDAAVHIDLVLGYPCQGKLSEWQAMINDKLQPLIGARQLKLNLSSHIASHVGRSGIKGLTNVKNIIAVASGKGGVGKSTVAVNLALALAAEGARAGILDADIYGPSQPTMLGVTEQPDMRGQQKFSPVIRHGIQSMSIGYLIDANTPMVWRGPMISSAMTQLLNDTQWDTLDYLIVDLPPGTGDIQLTLAQKIPVSAAIIVTTPQDLALADARRACAMFQKLHVPVLGVVENMTGHTCSQCGHVDHLFGEGGAEKLAQQFNLPVLSEIPLHKSIREKTDGGCPPVAENPDSEYAQLFRELARKVAAHLSLQQKDYSSKFPKIVVEG
jgi:ATP-binding protein involved in chromosome partitioning